MAADSTSPRTGPSPGPGPIPGPGPGSGTGLGVAPWLGPTLFAALLFANTLRNGFVYDDPLVLEWLKTRRWDLEGFLTETRGMTYAVHALDHWLWGDWAPGYHLTNVLLHCTCTALAALTAWTLTRSRTTALLCGLAFAAHPVHVEVVANVANRKDMLAMLFVLLGFLAWRGIESRSMRLAATTACYGLALYSKEVAAAGLVAALFLGDVWLPRSEAEAQVRPARRALGSAAALSPLVLAGLAAALVFATDLGSPFRAASIRRLSDGHYHTLGASLATSAGNLVDFARLLLFPARLQIDYALRPQSDLLQGRALAGLALAAAWIVLTLRVRRHAPARAFALAWVLLLFLPCSNLIPLHHIHVAERYLYVPSFGLCLALGHWVATSAESRAGSRPWILGAVALVLGAAGLRCVQRNRDWRDVPSLVAAADRDGVDTWRIHKTAASWAIRNGESETAAARYARAAALRPGDPDLQFWRAVSAARVGDHAGAIDAGRAATRLRPESPQAHYNLGLALIQVRDLGGAVRQLRRTTELEPEYAPAHYNLAVALSLSGDEAGALAAFEECVLREPDYAEAHFNLGALHRARGRTTEAIDAMRRAASLEPDNRRFLETLFALCVEEGRTFAAIEAGEVLARSRTADAELLRQVGQLCVEAGELPRGIGHLRAAVDAAPDDVRGLLALAGACELDGKTSWARDAYQRVLQVEPGHREAADGLSRTSP